MKFDKELLKIAKYFYEKTDYDFCIHYNWKNNDTDLLDLIYNNQDKEMALWEYEYYRDKIVEELCSDIESYIGMCGCGNPEESYCLVKVVMEIQELKHSAETWSKEVFNKSEALILEKFGKYGAYQFIAYILDNKGFLSHGSSIGGAWLTEIGKMYLYLAKLNEEYNE